MDLQMQLRRAMIALALFAALGGIALTRAAGHVVPDAALHATEPQAVPAALHVGQACPTRVHVDLGELRLSFACDRNCTLVREAAQAVGLAAAVQPALCSMWRTA